jgi:hypothetical protein
MRSRKASTLLALGAGILLLSGCSHSLLNGGIREGVIEYAMSFPDLDPNGLMAGMLPDKTVLSFNREQQSVDLSAGMGVFKTSMVVNTPKREMHYHMSVMGKSLMAVLRPRDLQSFNQMAPSIAVIQTNAVDTIAGFPCKQAYVIYEGIDHPEAEVWYTDAIPMDDPNWYSPYNEIPGVLMRYELVQHNVRLRLEATSVKACTVDPTLFADRPEHQVVSPKVLNEQLGEVLGAFSN